MARNRSIIYVFCKVLKSNKRIEISLGSNITPDELKIVNLHVSILVRALNQNRAVGDIAVRRWVEELDTNPRMYGVNDLYAKLAKIGLVPPRLEIEKKSLAKCIDEVLIDKIANGNSQQTIDQLQNVKKKLFCFFAQNVAAADITVKNAKDFHSYLKKAKQQRRKCSCNDQQKIKCSCSDEQKEKLSYADSSINGYIKKTKNLFDCMVENGDLQSNVFLHRNHPSKSDQTRRFYISSELVSYLIEMCSDQSVRLSLAFARFGGLRLPSDIALLRKESFDFKNNMMRIDALKGEKFTKGQNKIKPRACPLFPILKKYVQPFVDSLPNSAFLFPKFTNQLKDVLQGKRLRGTLRTKVTRFLRKQGVVSWKKLFMNLRASCATDLRKLHSADDVCSWLGHSLGVQNRYYKMVTIDNDGIKQHDWIGEYQAKASLADFGISKTIGMEQLEANFRLPDIKPDPDIKSSIGF